MIESAAQTVIEVVLGLTYIFVVFTIVTSKNKIFKNIFYVLFAATGAADIFAVYISIFFRLIRQLRFGPEIQQLVPSFVLISGITFFAHMIGNMIIALNRYSALCLMKNYD
ncbi:hypothetical protein OSTOST_16455, partial [Ostertagia ostertagi]